MLLASVGSFLAKKKVLKGELHFKESPPAFNRTAVDLYQFDG